MVDRTVISVRAEIDRFFADASAATSEQPEFVLLMGGVCAGKTSLRRQRFDRGYVLVDAAEIFLNLSGGRNYDFPSMFAEAMDVIGGEVARRAVRENRPIVSEIIGADLEPTQQLIDAMLKAGYRVRPTFIHADPKESWTRNLNRAADNISAHFTEPYHLQWLLNAAAAKTGS